jgi:GNAT superfamily N-acetyltransferase
MGKIEIRHARREDLRAIEEIFRSYEPAHDWKYARKYYEDFFGWPEQHKDDAVLVGVMDGRVVGVIGFNADRYEANDIYWLGWFYVHKDERGQDHGTKLLKQVIREVKKRGGRKLYTDTSTYAFYKGAHHRYQERGFKEEARLRDFYEKGEDQVIYGLVLT